MLAAATIERARNVDARVTPVGAKTAALLEGARMQGPREWPPASCRARSIEAARRAHAARAAAAAPTPPPAALAERGNPPAILAERANPPSATPAELADAEMLPAQQPEVKRLPSPPTGGGADVADERAPSPPRLVILPARPSRAVCMPEYGGGSGAEAAEGTGDAAAGAEAAWSAATGQRSRSALDGGQDARSLLGEWGLRAREALRGALLVALPPGRPFSDLRRLIEDYLLFGYFCTRCDVHFMAVGRLCNGCGAGAERLARRAAWVEYEAATESAMEKWEWPTFRSDHDFTYRGIAIEDFLRRQNRFLGARQVERAHQALVDGLPEPAQDVLARRMERHYLRLSCAHARPPTAARASAAGAALCCMALSGGLCSSAGANSAGANSAGATSAAATAAGSSGGWGGTDKGDTVRRCGGAERRACAPLLGALFAGGEQTRRVQLLPHSMLSKAVSAASAGFLRAPTDLLTADELRAFLAAGPAPDFDRRLAAARAALRAAAPVQPPRACAPLSVPRP